MRAVSANIQDRLPRAAARRCLDAALALEPDVVGLQEWGLSRFGLLRREPAYAWLVCPWGDCVVGLRRERFVVRRRSWRLLSRPALADAGVRRPPLLPPRWATVVEADDRTSGGSLGVVGFHLVPGSQSRGRYRDDRPRVTAQHRAEVRALQGLVDDLARRCDDVWALGDSNFHGLELAGLTSAWKGRPDGAGTLGSYRRIDDVFGPGPATRVELVRTESDHAMVLVERT